MSSGLEWDERNSGQSGTAPDIESGRDAGDNEESRAGPDAGPSEQTSTALSVVEWASEHGTNTADELLRAVTALMDTLNAERKGHTTAQEALRKAEADNAALRAQLELQQERRRQAETELKELRADVERRRRRAEKELEQISAGLAAPGEGRPPQPSQRRPGDDSGPGGQAVSDQAISGEDFAEEEPIDPAADTIWKERTPATLRSDDAIRVASQPAGVQEETRDESKPDTAALEVPTPPPWRYPVYVALSVVVFLAAIVIGLFVARLAG